MEKQGAVVAANELRVFIPITKVEAQPDGSVYVEGIATAEVLDLQGEVVQYDASVKAFGEWAESSSKATGGISLGNIREMHEPIAAGKAVLVQPDEASRSITLGSKVVDPTAATKCKEGVYTGYSIGGRNVKRDGNRIVEYRLSEVSLVDKPACPAALFTMVKRDIDQEAPAAEPAPAEPAEKTADVEPTPEARIAAQTSIVKQDAGAALAACNETMAAALRQLVAIATMPGKPLLSALDSALVAVRESYWASMDVEARAMSMQSAQAMAADSMALLAGKVAEMVKEHLPEIVKAAMPEFPDLTKLQPAAPAADPATVPEIKVPEELAKHVTDTSALVAKLEASINAVAAKVQAVLDRPAVVGRPVEKSIGSAPAGDTRPAIADLQKAVDYLASRGLDDSAQRALRLALSAESMRQA